MANKKKKKRIKLHIRFVPYIKSREFFMSFYNEWMNVYKTSYGLFSFDAFLWRLSHKRKPKQIKTDVSYIAYDFIGYPDKEQEELFLKTFGCCRFIWNKMKTDRDNAYKTGKKILPKPADYKKEFPWLKEVDSLALANVQLNLEKSYSSFIKGETGKPKYKKKHLAKDSYTTNVSNSKHPNIILDDNKTYRTRYESSFFICIF